MPSENEETGLAHHFQNKGFIPFESHLPDVPIKSTTETR